MWKLIMHNKIASVGFLEIDIISECRKLEKKKRCKNWHDLIGNEIK